MERKARLYDDLAGRTLKAEFNRTRAVIVPIFDGVKALSPSMRDWLEANFPHAFDELEGESGPGKIDVRIQCSKWWYYCDDITMPEDNDNDESQSYNPARTSQIDDEIINRLTASKHFLNPDGSFRASYGGLSGLSRLSENFNAENLLYFHLAPIIKRMNHRKHNSHQWFFDGICQGLEDKCTFAFLTDCGTTYNPTCLAKLTYELYFKTDLIGVTARQRVETPNAFFHPCEDSPFACLRGDHEKSGNQNPCWKCWATFFMSPCPLQGFEFEATLIMNSAMFNLVEALPVMPGPCQLLNWQKMKYFKVVDEYFNLLFKGEPEKRLPRMPRRLKRMSTRSIESVPPAGLLSAPSTTPTGSRAIVSNSRSKAARAKADAVAGKINFTEFLRVNMRLAEDRILSFVCVFSTGYGTKWIPGATFFYQPEIRWETLLTQRRRWLNGTFASFLFFFNSQRARSRIMGGMFDSHKAGKNIRFVNALWSLQLMQLALVLIAPAVFGSAVYIGLLDSAKKWPLGFGWCHHELFGPVRIAEAWVAFYLLLYGTWSIQSFYAVRGKMPELQCRIIAILGFFFIFPVYFAVWASIFTQGVDVIDGLVICSLLLPVVIALAQSATSATLYLLYLPWFLFLIIFFLVFIPAYSFSRLWDTTWGNRSTGKDSAINEKVEQTMKSRNFIFVIFMVTMNVFLVWAFIELFRFGYSIVLAFMFIVFSPMIVQLVCSVLFLFIVIPLRNLMARPYEGQGMNNSADIGTPSTLSPASCGGSDNIFSERSTYSNSLNNARSRSGDGGNNNIRNIEQVRNDNSSNPIIQAEVNNPILTQHVASDGAVLESSSTCAMPSKVTV
eukprot:scaffold525_cov170-Ochromonas_danica.AAC.3